MFNVYEMKQNVSPWNLQQLLPFPISFLAERQTCYTLKWNHAKILTNRNINRKPIENSIEMEVKAGLLAP